MPPSRVSVRGGSVFAVTELWEAEQFLFVREQFVLRPLRKLGFGLGLLRRAAFLQHAEHRALAALAVISELGSAGQHAVDAGEHAGTRLAQGIACPALDECFQGLAGDRADVHALAQIGEALEPAALLSGFDNRLHSHFADALDRGEAEADS
jgi:hypothetical protein